MVKSILAAAALAVATCSFQPAYANHDCAPRAEALENMEQNFGEVPVFRGVSQQGYVVEIFLSKGGSFTVGGTDTQGMTCTIDSGEGGELLDPAEAKRGRDS